MVFPFVLKTTKNFSVVLTVHGDCTDGTKGLVTALMPISRSWFYYNYQMTTYTSPFPKHSCSIIGINSIWLHSTQVGIVACMHMMYVRGYGLM